MFRIWTNWNAIRNPNQIAFLFLVSATMLQCSSEVFRGGNPEQNLNCWWHQSSNSVVICSYSTHGSHGKSQYFDPDLPSGNLLHSYWKLQFSSLIYPLIAWWFSSSLCKRLPGGMSSTAHGRMDLLRHWSTMNSSSQLVTNESPQSHCRCEWQNEHAHLRQIAMVHHWITIPRS